MVYNSLDNKTCEAARIQIAMRFTLLLSFFLLQVFCQADTIALDGVKGFSVSTTHTFGSADLFANSSVCNPEPSPPNQIVGQILDSKRFLLLQMGRFDMKDIEGLLYGLNQVDEKPKNAKVLTQTMLQSLWYSSAGQTLYDTHLSAESDTAFSYKESNIQSCTAKYTELSAGFQTALDNLMKDPENRNTIKSLLQTFGSFYFKDFRTSEQTFEIDGKAIWTAKEQGVSFNGRQITGGTIFPITTLFEIYDSKCSCKVWVHRTISCKKLCTAVFNTQNEIANMIQSTYTSIKETNPCAIQGCEIPGAICLPGKIGCQAPKSGISTQFTWNCPVYPNCKKMAISIDNFVGHYGRNSVTLTQLSELPKALHVFPKIRLQSYSCGRAYHKPPPPIPECKEYFQTSKTLQHVSGSVTIPVTDLEVVDDGCLVDNPLAPVNPKIHVSVFQTFGERIYGKMTGVFGETSTVSNSKSDFQIELNHGGSVSKKEDLQCSTAPKCPVCQFSAIPSALETRSAAATFTYTSCGSQDSKGSKSKGGVKARRGQKKFDLVKGSYLVLRNPDCTPVYDDPLELPIQFYNSELLNYVIPTQMSVETSPNIAECRNALNWFPFKDLLEGRANRMFIVTDKIDTICLTKFQLIHTGSIYIEHSDTYSIQLRCGHTCTVKIGQLNLGGQTNVLRKLAAGYYDVVIHHGGHIDVSFSLSLLSKTPYREWYSNGKRSSVQRRRRMDFRYARDTKKWTQSNPDIGSLWIQEMLHQWVKNAINSAPFPSMKKHLTQDAYGINLPHDLVFSNTIDSYIYLLDWIVSYKPDISRSSLPDLGKRIDFDPVWKIESIVDQKLSRFQTFQTDLIEALKTIGSKDKQIKVVKIAAAEFILSLQTISSIDRANYRSVKFTLAVEEAFEAVKQKEFSWADAYTHLGTLTGLYNVKSTDPDAEKYWFVETVVSIRKSFANPNLCESAATLAELVLLQKIPNHIIEAGFAKTDALGLGSGILDDLSDEVVEIFRKTKSFTQLQVLIAPDSCFKGITAPLRDICTNQNQEPLCELYRIFEQLAVFVTYRVGVTDIISLKSNANVDLKTYLDEILESNGNSEIAFLIYDEVEKAKTTLNNGLIEVSGQLRENFNSLGEHFVTVAAFDLEVAKEDVKRYTRLLKERTATFESLPLKDYFNDIFLLIDIALGTDMVIQVGQLAASAKAISLAAGSFDVDGAIGAAKEAVEEASELAGMGLNVAELYFMRSKFKSIKTTLTEAKNNLELNAELLKSIKATVDPIVKADDFSKISVTQDAFLEAYQKYFPPLKNTMIEGLRGDFEAIATAACEILGERRGAAQSLANSIGKALDLIEFPCVSVDAVIGSYFDEMSWMMDESKSLVDSTADLVRGAVVGASADNFRKEVAASVGVEKISAENSQLQSLLGVIISQISVQKAAVSICRHFMYTEGGANGRFNLCDRAVNGGFFFDAQEIIHLLSHDPHSTGYTVTRQVYLPTVQKNGSNHAFIDMLRLKETGKASFDITMDAEWLVDQNFISSEMDLENNVYYVKSFELFIPVITDVSKNNPKTLGYKQKDTYIQVRSALSSGVDNHLSRADSNAYELPETTSTTIYSNEHSNIWCPGKKLSRNPFAVCQSDLSNICIESSGQAQVKGTSPLLPSLFTRWNFEIELIGAEPGETIYPLIPLSSTEINIPASITLYVLKLDDEDLLLEEDNSESESVSDVCCPVGSYKPRWDGFKCEPCPEYSSTALGGAYCALDVDTVQNKLDCDQDIIFELNRKVTNYAGKKQPEPNAFCKNYNYLRNKKTLNQNQELGQENIEMVSDQALDGSLRLALYLTDQQN